MPAQSSVFKGLIEHADFAKKYVHARTAQANVLFDEMLHIADTPVVGLKTITKASGVETVEGGMIERRHLQIDARKWIIARMASKKYGDKQALEHYGPDGAPMEVAAVTYTDADRAKALADFMAKTAKREEA